MGEVRWSKFEWVKRHGVDVEDVFERLRLKPETLIRIVRRFAQDAKRNKLRAEAALDGELDVEGVQAVAHEVRGVALNLGISRIAQKAGAVEDWIEEHPEACRERESLEPMVFTMLDELEALHEAFRAVPSSMAPAPR